jgi:diguanylate cyclase (GGDEF)-like protein/PAS domain S-box-containing protein
MITGEKRTMNFPSMKFIQEKIQQALSPPVYDGDSTKTYRADLTHALILASAGFIFFLFIGNMLGGRISFSTQIVNILSFVVCVILYLLVRRGWVRFVGQVSIVVGIGLLTLAIASIGTIRAPATIIYLLYIIMAGLLFEHRAVLIATALSSLAVWGLIAAENMGFLPAPDYAVNISQWIAYTLFFLMSGGFTLYVTRTTKRAFARANMELAERQRTEKIILEKTEELDRFFTTTIDLLCIADTDGNFYRLNREWENTLGYPLAELEGVRFLDFVHPEDLEATLGVLSRLKAQEATTHFENRYRCKDGTYRWLEWRSSKPYGNLVYAAARDITERKKAEESLSEFQSRLHLLGQNLENVGLYVYSHDEAGNPHFEYLSAGMEALTGVQVEDALRNARAVHSTILPEYIPSLVELEAKSKRELAGFEMEFRQRHPKSGEVRWMLLRSTPRQRQDGSTVWYGVQMDITDRKWSEKLLEDANHQLSLRVAEIEQLQAELREQAIRDPLTGLYNRRYMRDAFSREFSRATRERHSISVIMLDMDELKWLNDTYGHHIGDRALQTFASCLQAMIRAEDIVCRYGGDEFTVVMSQTEVEDAVKRIEEWREFLSINHLVIEQGRVPIRFTAGIANFPRHGSSMEEMLHYSDVALYRAKARGRNCTAVFD